MYLPQDIFSSVIANTPLISIDLVIINQQGQALLGERLNRPAKGYWFVPGGRIQKNESLAQAFERLTRDELGEVFSIHNATCMGPYDHFYDDCVFDPDISTHYVAIAYQLILSQPLFNLPIDEQHSGYAWRDVASLLDDDNVHDNTK